MVLLFETEIAINAQIPTAPYSRRFRVLIIYILINPAIQIRITVQAISEIPQPFQFMLVKKAAILAMIATEIQPEYKVIQFHSSIHYDFQQGDKKYDHKDNRKTHILV